MLGKSIKKKFNVIGLFEYRSLFNFNDKLSFSIILRLNIKYLFLRNEFSKI